MCGFVCVICEQCLVPTCTASWFSIPAEEGGTREDSSTGVGLCVTPITYAPTFAVSMVTPCPLSVHTHYTTNLCQLQLCSCYLILLVWCFLCISFCISCLSFIVKPFVISVLERTCLDKRTDFIGIARQTSHPITICGSICPNLKSVTSCHHDSRRLFPSPELVCVCALLCVRASMCGSIRGGHISRVSRGWVAPLPACHLCDGRTSVGCDMKLGSISFSLLLPLSFACSLVSVMNSPAAWLPPFTQEARPAPPVQF